VASGYAVFETNGQIIDVAVDTVNYKMWYRVAGGAWQGEMKRLGILSKILPITAPK
jgi:hypothetical protein